MWQEIHDGPRPLLAREQRHLDDYLCRDGKYFRVSHGKNLLVVPRRAVRKVIHFFHDSPEQAHPGIRETIIQITQYFTWKRINRCVAEYIGQCLTCRQIKPRQPQPIAPLRAHKPTGPFEQVSIDILGPYPESTHGNKFVLIAEDIFSKWVEVKPVTSINHKEIIRFLRENIIARFGLPKKLFSDNSNLFRCKAVTTFCNSQGILQELTGTEHQRANPVERRVQELKKVMRALLIKHSPKTWDDWLPQAAAVLRRRTNAASGDSPSRVVLGYEPSLPGQWKIPQASREANAISRPTQQEILDRHSQYQAGYANPDEPPPVQFYPGDLILYRTKVRPAHPFAPIWLGPHPVIRAITDTLYEISINGVPSPRHVDNLRRAPPGNIIETDSSSDDQSDSEPESSSEGTQESGSSSGEEITDSSDYEPIPPTKITTTAQINSEEQVARRMTSAPALRPMSDRLTPTQTEPEIGKMPDPPDGANAPPNLTSRLLAKSLRSLGRTTVPQTAGMDNEDPNEDYGASDGLHVPILGRAPPVSSDNHESQPQPELRQRRRRRSRFYILDKPRNAPAV